MPASAPSRFLKISDVVVAVGLALIVGLIAMANSAYKVYEDDKFLYEIKLGSYETWLAHGGKAGCDEIQRKYADTFKGKSYKACVEAGKDCLRAYLNEISPKIDLKSDFVMNKCSMSLINMDWDIDSYKPLPYDPPAKPEPLRFKLESGIETGIPAFIYSFLAVLAALVIRNEKHAGWRRVVVVVSPVLGAVMMLFYTQLYGQLEGRPSPLLLWLTGTPVIGAALLTIRRVLGWIQQGFDDQGQVMTPPREAAAIEPATAIEPPPADPVAEARLAKERHGIPGFGYRAAARVFDYAICFVGASLVAILVGLALPVGIGMFGLLLAAIGGTVGAAVTFYLMEKWCVLKFGGSPGKLIAGLRIRDESGANLTLKAASDRSFAVLFKGAGFMIGAPQIQMFLALAFWITGKRGWEKGTEVIYTPEGVSMLRKGLVIICAVVLLTTVVTLGAISKMVAKNQMEAMASAQHAGSL